MAVDTIRFYQGKGLLDSPRREGRVTWYGEAHVERLKRIKELQQQGFTLTVIQRFLAGELEASDEALVAAVTRPAAPQTLTLGELAERSGVAEPLLRSLQQAGLLVPIEGGDEPLYPADDLEAIAAGMKLIAAGVPIGSLIELGKEAQWKSYEHDIHGFVYVQRNAGGSYAPDSVQIEAVSNALAFFDKYLKAA